MSSTSKSKERVTLETSCSLKPELHFFAHPAALRGHPKSPGQHTPKGWPQEVQSLQTLIQLNLIFRLYCQQGFSSIHTCTNRVRFHIKVATGRLKRYKWINSISERTISIIRHSTQAAYLLSSMWFYEPKEEEQVAPIAFCVTLGRILKVFIQTILPLTPMGVLPEKKWQDDGSGE